MNLRSRTLPVSTAVALTILLSAASAHAQYAELKLQSDPGDPIGRGSSYDIIYTPQNCDIFSTQIDRFQPSGGPDYITFDFLQSGSEDNYALLTFATNQLGTALQPGTYNNAERAAFASAGHPGLDVGFQHRGSNTLTGSFTIEEAMFTPISSTPNVWSVDSFQVDFVQKSEGSTGSLHGTFTYNAVTVPEASTLIFAGSGLILGMGSRHRKRKQRSL